METMECGRVIAHPVSPVQTVKAIEGVSDPDIREGVIVFLSEQHPPGSVRDGRV